MQVLSDWWRGIVVFLILVYTAVMLLRFEGMAEEHAQTMVYIEWVVVLLFLLEILVALVALGPGLYFSTTEQILDFVLVLLTATGFFFKWVESWDVLLDWQIGERTAHGLKLLRVTQLLRMLYKEPHIYEIMSDIFKTWRALLMVLMLVIFSTFMGAIIGMHLMGGRLTESCYSDGLVNIALVVCDQSAALKCSALDERMGQMCYPRSNFETFSNGVLASFQFILLEGWIDVYGWYSSSGPWLNRMVASIFCMVLYFWATSVLFNLYVAVLLINFVMDESLKIDAQKEVYYIKEAAIREEMSQLALQMAIMEASTPGADDSDDENDLVELIALDLDQSHKSLFLFGPKSKFRLFCAKVSTSHIWNVLWVTILTVASAAVAARSKGMKEAMNSDEPVVGDVSRGEILSSLLLGLEILVVAMFVLEMLLKSVSSGFVLQGGAVEPYLRDSNNCADFVFLIFYALSFVPFFHAETVETNMDGSTQGFEQPASSIDSYFKLSEGNRVLLRNMGPLVGLLQNRPIRTIILYFRDASSSVFSVTVPIIFMLVVFSIAGVELFSGRLWGSE